MTMKKLLLVLLLLVLADTALAQDVPMTAGPSKKVGKYLVSLRLPEGGLFSEEEQQIEFRIVDADKEDPVLGPTPIVRAAIRSIVSMPSMPSMPKGEETAHPEGIPGDYGLHPTFAHGGEYLLTLNVTPPSGDPFTVDFTLKVADLAEAPARKPRIKPFRVEVKAEPARIKAGTPTTLKLTVFNNREIRGADGRPTGKRETVQVKEFDVAHEKLLHLIVVRRDLGFYAHVHPEIQPDGTFTLPGFVFPTGGEYRLFCDTAPKGYGGQVLLATLKAEGPVAGPAGKGAPVTVTLDGLTVSRTDTAALPAKRTTLITFTVVDAATKQPVTNLEPYLGAMGHLILINEDAQTFVHSHPDERDPQNGKNGSLTFMVRPPKPGKYRGWLEIQRNGKLSQAEFSIEAAVDQN